MYIYIYIYIYRSLVLGIAVEMCVISKPRNRFWTLSHSTAWKLLRHETHLLFEVQRTTMACKDTPHLSATTYIWAKGP